MPIQFIYMIFGDIPAYHRQAAFSILSIIAQKRPDDSILVLTDHPEYYRMWEHHVATRKVDADELEEWKGMYGYFWRIKLKAIETIALTAGNRALVYLDTDTFLHGDLSEMRSRLTAGCCLMHLKEEPLAGSRSKTLRKMGRAVIGKRFAGITVDATHTMWNAGLVGLPPDMALPTIQKAIALCDAFCAASVTPRLIEQFALSVSLAETGKLIAADVWWVHYWGNKVAWEAFIGAFFNRQLFCAHTIEQQCAAFGRLHFDGLPLHSGRPNTSVRLERLVRRLFPDKPSGYVERVGDS